MNRVEHPGGILGFRMIGKRGLPFDQIGFDVIAPAVRGGNELVGTTVRKSRCARWRTWELEQASLVLELG